LVDVLGLVPPPAGAVCVGVDEPPVLDGVVVGAGVTAVPPEEGALDELGALLGVVVVDVVVVDVEADEEGAGVPPEGGAVSTGVVFGTS